MVCYKNPVLPGFYPDPSVCRKGEDYYLVNSSFEFFPGIPIFHSKNLVEWEQIGHVLTRKSQLDLADCPASGGIWAPTIRLNKNRFYVSATNYRKGGNFYVWTDDIYQDWSEPLWVEQGGIDPSLFFDEDGTTYFTSTYDYPDGQAIGQCVIDIKSGKKLTETKVIWGGSGGKYTEGPHMFRRGKWYYLLAAEGGTEYGHMVTTARSTSPWGPFENCPRNPILTHRDTMLHHFQAIGHADFVDTPEGITWAVFHGIRTSQYMLHHMGRETMLAPVLWDEEEWPVINNRHIITEQMEVEKLPAQISINIREKKSSISFPEAADGWNYLRNPEYTCYLPGKTENSIVLKGSKKRLDECKSPTFIGMRQQDFCFFARVKVEFEVFSSKSNVGMSIYHTNEHHYDLMITQRNERIAVVLRKRVGDMLTESAPVYMDNAEKLVLQIQADRLHYVFYCGLGGERMEKIGSGRTQLLSTECMPMTFTGCFIGLFAEEEAKGEFSDFCYIPQNELTK